ncbi:zinc finger CCCH domain-containing protein 24-like [Macadamia integrifolia]|uniref:zinc finger CCCH domain-containing protein 24-like n=1 Tax=Macadamia integrifolia TaxID=60698 RepID=UPI001C4F7242|nr:zinc finger CCCH domain-containing protein 24-like [Macadamia integrifolia]
MSASPGNTASVTDTENPSHEVINSFDTLPLNAGDSIEQLRPKTPDEVGTAAAAGSDGLSDTAAAGEETQPLNLESEDCLGSLGEKRKREDTEAEEANGEAKDATNPLWKTTLCSYFRRSSGSCSHGDGCRYAHGEEELRVRPDNTWDPTSERAKKLMKCENGERVTNSSDVGENVLMTDALVYSSDPSLAKCLVHLPRNWTSDKLRSHLTEQGISFETAKKKKGMTVGFVTFESTEQVKNAIEMLDGKPIASRHVKVADIIPRSFENKTRSTIPPTESNKQHTETFLTNDNPGASVFSNNCQDPDSVEKSELVIDGSVSSKRNVSDVVTPLAHMPYSDQLEHKKSSLLQTLKKLSRNARKACPDKVPLPEWILKSREIGGLPCKLEGILESPLVNEYRNKCEFSVGYSVEGKLTVGFMLGNFREGVTAVEEPVGCPNVSRIACRFALIFQEFLQHSTFPVWNRINNTGFWRQLTVREGRDPGQTVETGNPVSNVSEVMLMVQVCSLGVDDELITSEFERMVQHFVSGAAENSPPLPLTALVIQDHTGISNVAPADAPLRPLAIQKAGATSGSDALNNTAEARIHDYICNLRFSISPTAFFQVNTLAAEKLYLLAGEWAGLGPDTLLFDVCCGTGTIGLTLAHRVGMVVGIEMNASAVSDAHRNAEINGIKNCRFVCGKAEDVMGSLLKEYLNVPPKKDVTDNVPVSSGEEDTHDREKKEDASVDKIPDLEEKSKYELSDVKSASGCPNIGGDEYEEPIKNSCILEDNNKVPNYKEVVAIVDPPRVGLHPVVIKALRTHPCLRRLVYISCNPESLVANAIELCTPSTDKTERGNKNNRAWRNMSSAGLARHRAKSMPNSEPFRPVKAMAVDLFPHTPHCELVMLLER